MNEGRMAPLRLKEGVNITCTQCGVVFVFIRRGELHWNSTLILLLASLPNRALKLRAKNDQRSDLISFIGM